MTKFERLASLLPRIGVLVFVFCALSLTAFAQNNKGTIAGTVKDPNQALVKDARITVINTATGETREAKSSDDGTYTVPNLDPGTYRVSADSQGFQTVVFETVQVETNSRVPLDVNFSNVTGGSNTVTVTSDSTPLVESETSVRGDVITGREIVDLPLPQRNFTILASLTPGVSRPAAGTIGGGGNFESGGPGNSTESTRFRESGGSVIAANGARPTNNNFTLDGADNNETQFGQIAIFPSPDEIREFKVETSVYSAESGRAGGAIISATTKSGTNAFHGDLYEFYQGRYASALPSRLTHPGTTFIPNSNTHNFGGVVGGPIFLPAFNEGGPHLYNGRNKSFFFFSYNGQRNSFPAFNTVEDPVTVPTVKMRTGDFSELLQPGTSHVFNTIHGPVTAPLGTIFDKNGNPFPGNIIPSSLFDRAAFNLLNAYPVPTSGGLERNYARHRHESDNINGYSVRLDHNITKSNSLFGRYSKQKNERIRDNNFPIGSSPNGTDLASGFGAGQEFGNSRQIALGDTQIFSPTIINDARAGYHRVNIGIFNPGIGGSLGFSPTVSRDLGFNNINVCGVLCEGTLLLGFAANDQEKQLEFVGDGGPFFFNSNNYYFGDTLTVIHGNQAFRVGGDLRVRQNRNVDAGRQGGSKGNIQYGTAVGGFNSGQYAGVNLGPNDSGSSIANFLIGAPPAFVTRGNPGGPALLSNKEIDFFVQDDWKVRPDLTLNLGLRYDLFTLPTERHDAQVGFDLATGNLVRAGANGPLGRDLGNPDKNNIGPRIGFAYSGLRENRKMVVRGGYGLTYALDISGRPPLTFNPGFSASYNVANRDFGRAGSPIPALFNLASGLPFPTPVAPAPGASFRPASAFETIYYLDPNNKTELFHQYNLTLQDEFASNWLAEIAYVGAIGRNLLTVNNIGSGTNGPGSREVPTINTVIATRNIGKLSYNSFQSKLERRFSTGFSLISTYVWSHAIDNTSGGFPGLGNIGGNNFGFSNPLNPNLDRGDSDFDIRHRFTFASVYDLPLGHGRMFGGDMNRTLDFLIGGFQLNTNIQIQSGAPWTPRIGDTRPDLIGDPTPTDAQRARGLQINPAAFRAATTPVFASDPTGPKFGTLGRNVFRGNPQEFVDASLFKNFRVPSIGEQFNFQIRISAFNLFNHVNRSTPVRDFNDSNFGIDTSEQRRRQLEFGFKLLF